MQNFFKLFKLTTLMSIFVLVTGFSQYSPGNMSFGKPTYKNYSYMSSPSESFPEFESQIHLRGLCLSCKNVLHDHNMKHRQKIQSVMKQYWQWSSYSKNKLN